MEWLVFAIDRTAVNRETGCWEYSYDLSHNGYGRVMIDGKRVRIHRASFSHFVGEIPEGMLVCHRCDVRHCWNPNHLFAGTSADNYYDMVNKGRAPPLPRPSYFRGLQWRGGRPTLNEDQVREIRDIAQSGGMSNAKIGSLYGVTAATIQKIRSGRTWSHVA